MLSQATGLLETRQDPMVDRYFDHAFHSYRAEINQKLTFRNTKVYGDASKVQRVVRQQSERTMGEQPGFSFDFDPCARKAVRMSQESTNSNGDRSSSL